MWMDSYGRDGDVRQHMLMSSEVGLCRGVTQGGNNNGDDDMACVCETERFSRFAVARDETNKEAVSDVSLKSAWGTCRTNNK